jgi:hypothetical protein
MNLFLAALLAFAIGKSGYSAYDCQNQANKADPSEKRAQCPDDRAWTGKYRNYSYGFTIVIPKKLKGFWNSPACVAQPGDCICMQDHGRIIPLSAEPYEPDRHIEAYAGNTAHLDNPTIAEAVRSELGSIRENSRKNSVQIRKRFPITLSGLKGERVVVRYYDVERKRWMMEDFIELVRGGVEYSLHLRTPEGTYEHDRGIFDSLVATFAKSKRIW